LGYVQVRPNFLVRKIHVVAIDFTFVYMSDMRKINWSRKCRESNWELLQDKYRRDSQWNIEKTLYIECDLWYLKGGIYVAREQIYVARELFCTEFDFCNFGTAKLKKAR